MLLGVLAALAFSACDSGRSDETEEPQVQQHQHTVVIDEAVAPTCTESGLTEGSHCSECGQTLNDQQYVEPPGHSEAVEPETPATCTDPGLSESIYCSVCNEILSGQYTIQPSGHDLNYYSGCDPTCESIGWYDYEKCVRCDYTTYTELAKTGHIEGEAIIDIPAQLGVAGSQHTECIYCGMLMSEAVIPAAEYSVGFYMEIGVDGYYIRAMGECTDKNIVIPEEIDGTKVVGISANAFANNTNIESIVIPSSIKSIAFSAFSYCTELKSVTIAEGVESLGQNLFDGCTSLKEVVIPESVTKISSHVFKNCSSLEKVTLPKSLTEIPERMFAGCNSLKSIELHEGITSIGEAAFYNCSSLAEPTFPSTLKSIENGSFSGCVSFKELVIPATVTEISPYSFTDCTSLESAAFPITSSNNSEYQECKSIFGSDLPESLKTIVINALPAGVTELASSVFKNCNNVESITLPDGITSIGSEAFSGCHSLISLNIPSTVTSVGIGAFDNCQSLEYAEADGVYYLGDGQNPYVVVMGAVDPENVTELTVADSAKVIVPSAFANCQKLTSISMPAVTEIGAYAFSSCSQLSRISIPSVIEIGEYAFRGCSSLASITIPETLERINNGAFAGCTRLTSVHITDIEKWCNITYVPPVNDYETLKDCYPLAFATELYINGSRPTSLVIPEGVTAIPPYAFSDSYIMTVSLPSTLKSIGNYAFSRTNLLEIANASEIYLTPGSYGNGDIALNVMNIYDPKTEQSALKETDDGFVFMNVKNAAYLVSYNGEGGNITLPEFYEGNIYSIRKNAFSGNSSITGIFIPETVESIERGAISGCDSIASITLPYLGGNNSDTTGFLGYIFGSDSSDNNGYHLPYALRSVTLLGGNEIPGNAFYNCSSIEEIIIPDTVQSIGVHAFSGCSSLSSITIPESVKLIDNRAFMGCSVLKSINIPAGVESIGVSIFAECSSLEEITVPFIPGETNATIGAMFGSPKYADNVNYIPETLRSVTVLGGDTIGDNAFRGCSNLKSITLPETLESIGGYAFMGCSGIEALNIPASVSSIGDSAFKDCSALKAIELPARVSAISNSTFEGCASLESLSLHEGIMSIGGSAFSGCTMLKELELPSTLESIGLSAFKGCSSLERLTLPFVGVSADSDKNTYLGALFGSDKEANSKDHVPESLKTVTVTGTSPLSNSAFYNCIYITAVNLPEGMEKIGNSAFTGCESLKDFTIPSTVTEIGGGAFAGCKLIENVTLPEGLTMIGDNAFGSFEDSYVSFTEFEDGYYLGSASNPRLALIKVKDTEIKAFTFDAGTRIVYQDAFYGCSKLEAIEIPSTITWIGRRAFLGCSKLETVSIPESITEISPHVFCDCINLVSVTFPDSLTKIGQWAFAGCERLFTVTIPEKVTLIDNLAFLDCISLIEVYNKSALNITASPFATSHGEIGKHALSVYTTEGGSKLEVVGDGYVFMSDLNGSPALVGYVGSSVDLVLPDYYNGSSYYIKEFAFYNNRKIRTLHIGKGVTTIGESAFEYCDKLYKVTADKDCILSSICEDAFYACQNMVSFTVPKDVTKIPEGGIFGGSNRQLMEIINYSSLELAPKSNKFGDLCDYAEYIIKDPATEATKLTYTEDGFIFYTRSYLVYDEVNHVSTTEYNHYLLAYIGNKTDIVLPESCNGADYYINERAFNRSDITSVVISKNVTYIYAFAFNECADLESIVFEAGSKLQGTAMSAIQVCNKLTEITLPEGFEGFGVHMFNSCKNLKVVYVPSTITGVSYATFANCSGLTDIYYNGTMSEWKALPKGDKGSDDFETWYYNTGDFVIHCTDGNLNKYGNQVNG